MIRRVLALQILIAMAGLVVLHALLSPPERKRPVSLDEATRRRHRDLGLAGKPDYFGRRYRAYAPYLEYGTRPPRNGHSREEIHPPRRRHS